MHWSLSVLAYSASAVVALPQGMNLDAVLQAPPASVKGPAVGIAIQTPTYVPSAAAQSAAAAAATHPVSPNGKRAACDVQPQGAAPTPTPNTFEGFTSFPEYSQMASNAATPSGYSQTFSNLNGSVQGAGYLGLYTLTAYDTVACQQYCDAAQGCYGFNVYIERDASLEPGPGCEDPTATFNYECTLWGLPITSQQATNVGQYQGDFHIGVQASNGYAKYPPPPSYPGFDGPVAFDGAIEASNYMGMRFFEGNYDPGQCAAACQASTLFDTVHLVHDDGTYDACNFFNAYVLSENYAPQGTYCSFYTVPWGADKATNVGQWRGEDHYTVGQSYGYSLNPQDPGHV